MVMGLEKIKIGKWGFPTVLFGVGIFLAVVLKLFSLGGMTIGEQTTINSLIIFSGLLLGLVNILPGERQGFLISVIALAVGLSGIKLIGGFAAIPTIGAVLASIFDGLFLLFAPAAVIVALGEAWKHTSSR